MKALQIISFLGCMSIQCFSQYESDQPITIHIAASDYLLKIVKSYFRSNPYQNEFGVFLKHLINDPILINKTMKKKTDSSLFFFQGEYKNFSPFNFLADRTEIRLAEQEFSIDDSLSSRDTLFVYQLLGYSNGKTGSEDVKNEFSKFSRHYSKHFVVQSSGIKNGTEIVGSKEDYFVPGVAASPLTVAWARLDEFQNAFIITIRLKTN